MFRHTIVTAAAGAFIAVAALTGCSAVPTGDTGDTGTAPAGSEPSSPPAADSAPGLNTPVTSGSLQFTALAVGDAGTTAGTSPLSQTAQGTFMKVDLVIANVGNEGQTFLVNYVKLVDAAGRQYTADSTATLYASGDAQSWMAAINPGNSVQVAVLFDVPVGTQASGLLVSDSMFGSGEKITLG